MLLDIHGLVIRCEAPSRDLAVALTRPFSYFETSSGTPLVTIRVEPVEPPYATFPPLEARFSTPRNVVYHQRGLKIVDYFGRGAVVQDDDRQVYALYSADENLLREIFYLLVLSLLGQFCDRVGRLRVHALAVSHRDRAFLFPMPPGSGKSTLALALLQGGRVGYISDDDPFFDRKGRVLSFPRALGFVNRSSLQGIPAEFIYQIDRMEFGTKYFVDARYWTDRIERRTLTEIVIVLTRRVLNGTPAIEPTSRTRVLVALLRDAVFGIGLYQGLEFLVSHSPWELGSKIPILWRRLILAVRLSRAARPYELTATRDRDQVHRVVTEFIETLP